MKKYIMALDSGTTSNRCILFDREGVMRSVAQKEFTGPRRWCWRRHSG
ncbi:MAG: hypothetical protein IJI48_00415 [Ruminococcus sp.]|nr:hypothetical protein [Ruminococcus sp.]